MYLAQNLKFLRTKYNYSQAEAADKIGIPRTTLGDYERDYTEPNMELRLPWQKYMACKLKDY
ncbi:MAG: helix-turn-helix transcriptional regulator [Saprospiraceae bacterium]|nr:helix-turn-helix transcriptional regulator [Saprospiraceae bacterium]